MNIIGSSVATIHCAVFSNNSARGNDSRGGAILARTNTIVSLVDTEFCGNSAKRGGMLFAQFATLSTSGYLDIIQHNTGELYSIYLTNCIANFGGNLTFTNNHQPLFAHSSIVNFTGASLFANGSVSKEETAAITSLRSEININHDGILTAQGNQGDMGGAMILSQSELNIYGQCHFLDNHAPRNGGAIHADRSTITFEGITNFYNNIANHSGGAISLEVSTIQLKAEMVSFTQNHAKLGGAIYLHRGSRLHIIKHKMECDFDINDWCAFDVWYCTTDKEKWQLLSFANNSAEKGGAIYVDDIGADLCSTANTSDDKCFIQTIAAYIPADDWVIEKENFANINFTNNKASSGAVLYGGLLDRCKLDEYAEVEHFKEKNNIDALSYFKNITGTIDFPENDIASDPMRVCLCDKDDKVDCDMTVPDFSVVPGNVFNYLKFAVVDQIGTPFTDSHVVKALLSSESSRLEEDESEQMLEEMCSKLNFTIYTEDSVNLTLYAKESPCTDGISILLKVKLESECPVGFSLSNS